MATIQIPESVKEKIILRIRATQLSERIEKEFISGIAAAMNIEGKVTFDRQKLVFISEDIPQENNEEKND
jgi:hypothetical protein